MEQAGHRRGRMESDKERAEVQDTQVQPTLSRRRQRTGGA